jgi:hypothetical protein
MAHRNFNMAALINDFNSQALVAPWVGSSNMVASRKPGAMSHQANPTHVACKLVNIQAVICLVLQDSFHSLAK